MGWFDRFLSHATLVKQLARLERDLVLKEQQLDSALAVAKIWQQGYMAEVDDRKRSKSGTEVSDLRSELLAAKAGWAKAVDERDVLQARLELIESAAKTLCAAADAPAGDGQLLRGAVLVFEATINGRKDSRR